jgi:hypothetical protein
VSVSDSEDPWRIVNDAFVAETGGEVLPPITSNVDVTAVDFRMFLGQDE